MHIFNCIWQGLLAGVVLSLMLGTVFFSLIRNSLKHGYRSGVQIAFGVIVCDIIFISLGILSHGFALFLKKYALTISVCGGIILVIMGIYMYFKAKPATDKGKELKIKKKGPFYYFATGFLLNVMNPVNFFSWLAISSMLTIKNDYDIPDKIIFFSASLLSIFVVEILIAHFATKLKTMVTPLVMHRVNQVSGAIFFLLGLKLAIGPFL